MQRKTDLLIRVDDNTPSMTGHRIAELDRHYPSPVVRKVSSKKEGKLR